MSVDSLDLERIVRRPSACHSGCGFRWYAREYVWEADRRSLSPLWLSTTCSAPPLYGNPMSAQISWDNNKTRNHGEYIAENNT